MSENVELVRRGYEAWQAGDLGRAMAGFDDEMVTRRFVPALQGTWHGKEGFLEVVGDWVATFDDFEMSAEEFLDAGDRVLVHVIQRGHGEGGGVPVESSFWFLHTIRDGRVVAFDLYASERQAREAAGLKG